MTLNIESSIQGGSGVSKSVLNLLCRKYEGLKLCHFNAQSLLPKADEFQDIFNSSSADIILVSETWFKPHTPVAQISLPRYKLFRNDRLTHGGGVAIYVRDNIAARIVGMSSDGNAEFIFIETKVGYEKCLIGCVYKPPKIVSLFGTELETFLNDVSHEFSYICVGGDFNSNLLDKASSSDFVDFVKSFGLNVVNTTFPTHFTSHSSTLLDVFLISDSSLVNHYDQISLPIFSNHDMIFMSVDILPLPLVSKIYSYHDFSKIDLNALLHSASNCNWRVIFNYCSVDDQVAKLEENILNLFSTFVPLKIRRQKSLNCPWFTDSIKVMCRRRDEAYRAWKHFRVPGLFDNYRLLRNKVVREIRKSKAIFFRNKFDTSLPIKTLWRNLHFLGVGKKCQNADVGEDPNLLNSQFLGVFSSLDHAKSHDSQFNIKPTDGFALRCVSDEEVFRAIFSIKSDAVGIDNVNPKFVKLLIPVILPYITFIFNSIITRSTFPCAWKLAKIIPVPKKSKSTTPEYRPIAILPFLAKAFERVISNQIIEYTDNSKLITDLQSGFRKHKSCTTALLKISDDLRAAVDDNMISIAVLLDFSKAFDSVDHRLLVQKLITHFKFSSSASKLIFSYLQNRSQSVYCGGSFSKCLPNSCGVPQGSILGPLLFSLFINDLPSVMRHSSFHLYADDVQIYLSRPRGLIEDAVVRINEDLNSIMDWAYHNKLLLNASKSACMLFFRKVVDISDFPPVMLGDTILPYTNEATNLGIKFDSQLSWSGHVNSVVSKIYGILRKLSVSAYFTPCDTKLLLVRSLIVPIIIYGCEVYSGANRSIMRKLEMAFNATVRYVYGLKKYDRLSSHRNLVLGCSLERYLEFRCLLFLRKLMLTSKPSYLHSKLSFSNSSRALSLIPINHKYLISDRQYFIRAIRLWNDLPLDIKRKYGDNNFNECLFNYLKSLV